MSEQTFKFRCPACRGKIGATEEHTGLNISCPHCGVEIVVPRPGTEYAFRVSQEPPPLSDASVWADRPESDSRHAPANQG